MKKLILFVAALCCGGASAQAQVAPVPNGGLDTWTGTGAQQRPQGWLTTADLSGGALPIPINNVTRTTASRTGAAAAQLATVNLFVATVPAFMTLGNRPATNSGGGIAYTSRPARMEFYYKLTGARAVQDSAFAGVQLTRTVAGVQEVIADTFLVFTTASSTYRLVSLPLRYYSSNTPDTLQIIFGTGIASQPTAGTTLTIDDVTLAGTAAAARDAAANAALSLYPTSSSNGHFTLSVSAPGHSGLLSSPLSVTDATGRVVLRQAAAPASSTRPVELPRNTAPGLYLLRLDTPSGPLTRRLVVE